ncbi:MAG: hypothetical protein IJQ83_08415, partial [Bacteroidales bacterium]|nr:hypothetical protein [Bacteroidales bacterium]
PQKNEHKACHIKLKCIPLQRVEGIAQTGLRHPDNPKTSQSSIIRSPLYSVLPYFSEDFVSKIKQSVPGEALIFGSCVPMPLQIKVPRANPDPDSDNCKIAEEWFKEGTSSIGEKGQ